MEIKVYNWEYFERGKTRYIVFALLILTVIVISILSKNYIWWVLVFLVSWWYIFYATKRACGYENMKKSPTDR